MQPAHNTTESHNTAITKMYKLKDDCIIEDVQHLCAKETTGLLATLGKDSGNLKRNMQQHACTNT